MIDVKKVVNQPYSGNQRELASFVNKLRQEFSALAVTLKSIKDYEKVVVFDSYGPLYVGKLAGIDPVTLNIFLYNAYSIRGDYTVPKVLVRGDIVKRIEYVTDAELKKIFSRLSNMVKNNNKVKYQP
ncbi:MAG: hypothetical protein DRN04_18185 [Thermoprotei archaeon]|nr:MAG: hypothetical protein DRJ52_09775 [Thermoprotei archaeon]RLE87419.1 MAG: hypothetical protein DRN04_18185 [Thermoprotei archaeon]